MIWLVAGLLVLLARPLLTRPASAAVGQRIVGHLYEIVVYRDVPGQIGRVLLRIVGESARLARALLMPCLILLIPTGLALAMLSRSQSVRPLHVGETAVLTVAIKDPTLDVKLELPPEIEQDSVPLEIQDSLEIAWRLKAKAPGRFQITLRPSQGAPLTKEIIVGEGDSPWDLEAVRSASPGLGERALPSESWAREIALDYPHREFWMGSYEVGWLGVFVLALCAWGTALEVVVQLKHP